MPVKSKRLRIMAGPNGSGKSTILEEVRRSFYSGPYINADDIKQILLRKQELNVFDFAKLQIEDTVFQAYLENSGTSWKQKASNHNLKINLNFSDNHLRTIAEVSDYDAAMAADFLRQQLVTKGETFTFETVMSHHSKIDLIKEAISQGFKVYLYFICTVDPAINVARVHQRVLQNGHHVPEDKIVSRYYDTLNLLSQIIPLCHRVFFFDNSDERSIDPIAEIDDKKEFSYKSDFVPAWLKEYVVDKF